MLKALWIEASWIRASWKALCIAVLLGMAVLASAKEAAPAADDPVVEARMLRIAAELRCLVCQNQTIADSHAALAVDLRNQVREMIRRGESDQQIIDFMTQRYGDFVLYRPPLKGSTALLWFGPGLLLAIGTIALVLVVRRRQRLAPDRFEADPLDPPDQPPTLEDTR